jgi:hypothetical protein
LAATLSLLSDTTSSKVINHHLFCVERDAKLATKRRAEVMWHDANVFDAESSMPDSTSKSLKRSSAAFIRGAAGNSSILIEHHCGTKKTEMTVDEHAITAPLKDLLLNKLPIPPLQHPLLVTHRSNISNL